MKYLAILAVLICSAWNNFGQCYSPPAGVVAWWPGNGNANDIWAGFNGIASNGVTYATGEVGQAFNFGNSGGSPSSFVSAPYNSGWNFNGNFTIECWAYFYSNTIPNQVVVSQDAYPAQGLLWALAYNFTEAGGGAANTLAFYIYNSGATENELLSSCSFTPVNNTWYHIAVTYATGNVWNYYTDAVTNVIGNNHYPFTMPNPVAPTIIGNDFESGAPIYPFAGLIDELTIYTNALSQAQITGIYNAGASGKCGSLPSGVPFSNGAFWLMMGSN